MLADVVDADQATSIFTNLIKMNNAVLPSTPYLYHYVVEAMYHVGFTQAGEQIIQVYFCICLFILSLIFSFRIIGEGWWKEGRTHTGRCMNQMILHFPHTIPSTSTASAMAGAALCPIS